MKIDVLNLVQHNTRTENWKGDNQENKKSVEEKPTLVKFCQSKVGGN